NLQSSRFLIPDGYVGWVQLEHNVKDAAPVQIDNGIKVFKFSVSGVLSTSSDGPDRGADDEYFYYREAGAIRDIPTNYKAGQGMIWGAYEGSKAGQMTLLGFFIGTEEQYKKYRARQTRPGPIPNP